MKHTTIIALVCFIFVMALIQGCERDELIPDIGPIDDCDTTNISYTNLVLPMMEENCIRCHKPGNALAGVDLVGYENVKLYSENGRMMKSLQGSMRQYLIDDCKVLQLQAWINQGMQDN